MAAMEWAKEENVMDRSRKARLEAAGVRVEEALERFLDNEELMLRFMLRLPGDPNFPALCRAMPRGPGGRLSGGARPEGGGGQPGHGRAVPADQPGGGGPARGRLGGGPGAHGGAGGPMGPDYQGLAALAGEK